MKKSRLLSILLTVCISIAISCDNKEGFIKSYNKAGEKIAKGLKDDDKPDDPLAGLEKRLDDYDKKSLNNSLQDLDKKLSSGKKICPPDTEQLEVETENKGKIISCELTLKDLKGLKEGPYVELNEKGIKLVQGNYFNGKRDGMWIYFTLNSAKYEEIYFKKGRRDGKYTSWFENQNVKEEGEYVNDQKEGIWLSYDIDGKKIYANEYKNGKKNGIAEKYYDNGKAEFHGEFLNNLETGKWTYYYKTGVIKTEGEFEKGRKTGKWQEFSTDGKLLFSRDFSQIKQEPLNKNKQNTGSKFDTL